MLQISISVRCATCQGKRTISHTHTQIVDSFPVRKGLDDGILTTISVVMIILQVVSDKELVVALCTQEQSKAEIMDDAPGQRVQKLEGERTLE